MTISKTLGKSPFKTFKGAWTDMEGYDNKLFIIINDENIYIEDACKVGQFEGASPTLKELNSHLKEGEEIIKIDEGSSDTYYTIIKSSLLVQSRPNITQPDCSWYYKSICLNYGKDADCDNCRAFDSDISKEEVKEIYIDNQLSLMGFYEK